MEITDLETLKSGKHQAFALLYERYYKELYCFAYHFIMSVEAEDVVQDVFVKLYEKRKNLPANLDIKSYLYRSTKNSCLNYLRHLKIVDREQERVVEAIIRCHMTDENENDEISRKVNTFMNQLSPQQRKIIELRTEGLDYKTIASNLSLSVNTINTQIARAYQYFRENFIFILFFTFFKN